MKDRVYKGLVIGFILIWVTFIFLDFWQKHPLYSFALHNFQYLNLTLFFAVIGAGTGWWVLRQNKNKTIPFYFNWLSVFGIGVLCIVGSMLFYQQVAFSGNTEGSSIAFLVYKILSTAFLTYLVILVCYVIGYLIGENFDLRLEKSAWWIIRVGLGVMGMVAILFLLGVFSLLKWYLLLPIFALLISFAVQPTIAFLKMTLIEPINISKDLNWLGFASFYLIIVIISLNFVQIISPFPTGFDSLTLYANLPSLIHDHAGLIEGYQPYNWSLFMALGYVLFDQTEIMLALSFIPGVLCLPVMYSLGKNWLKMDSNFLLLTLLVFYITPAVMHQSYAELKVDLGLLFIYLCIILLFSSWLKVAFKKENKEITNPDHEQDLEELLVLESIVVPDKKSKKQKNKKLKVKNPTLRTERVPAKKIKLEPYDNSRLLDPYIILIGLLSGFAMGIKLTTLFVFFAVIAGIWYAYGGKLFYLTVFTLGIFGILLLKVDDMGGLRQYHLSANILMGAMLLIGLVLLFFAFKQDKEKTFLSLKRSVLYGVFFVLPFSPWIIKNAVETKSLSPQSLLNGKATGPDMNMKIINENWKGDN